MDTAELIKILRDDATTWSRGGYPYNAMLPSEAADKLEQLQNIIDGMLGDHYVDYLDFYANRCRELEEKLQKIEDVLKK